MLTASMTAQCAPQAVLRSRKIPYKCISHNPWEWLECQSRWGEGRAQDLSSNTPKTFKKNHTISIFNRHDKWILPIHVTFQKQVIIARAHSVLLFAGRNYKKGHGITGKVITSIPSPGAIKMTDAGHLKSSAKLCKDKFIIHLDPCTWKYNWNEKSINQKYYQCLLRVWKAKYLNTKSQHESTNYSTEIEHDSVLRGNKTKSSIIKGTFLEAIHLLL